ncbi:TPA: phage portal protein [Neisseria gonorrhoeae]|uniref:phage portal protein n=2 Tax=Neisseria gonorrhoeae TaxID=485 RepID=UPI0007E4FEDB|nr:phage portal protein [Neisseria gonorrhoeae]ANJ48014.1 phage head morphogenesis protein [Neisseria gonorrhoeae]MCF2974171.1 phage portal protein [Neisseria gonorrhoeae]MCF2978016.1 phage portal protein [Neisseria gonorrhoeae]MCF3005047.1 phage portal protein [Neisseria gonorrhoeae]MCF3031508.1 phage portal protein [Neisseria gonorrhoeae]
MSKKTPLSQGFIARVAAGVRYAFTGNADGWFDAGEPPAPAAQQAEGRRFDYEPFYNVGHSKPREREAVGFAQLRALADNYDVLRLVIEARKDQMECLKWTIQKRDVESTEDDESQRKDRKVDEAVAFFRSPDKEHTWADWLRILLEDLFVIDAPCIYPRKTLGGGLYALEVMDGATIKRVLDNTGRMPLPPDTAYQQILHGMAAVDYTADELIYRSRNNRSYKVYGYSPVEQIIMTVNIALKRQVHALEYYTAGSVPDALVGVPETWSADDIRRFQEYWDLLLSGETAQRRKMRFVPGELSRNFRETKQPPLKDVYDEWLARVVCFAFSVEPTPFVAQVNRSVAETSREQSLSDGMGSLKNWVKALIDDVLARYMDMAAYEFVWKGEESLNPKEQAEIYAIYKNAGILTADEIRAELGKEPLPGQGQPEPDKQDGRKPEEPPNQGAEKLGKSESPMSEDESAALIEAYLLTRIDGLAEQIAALIEGAAVDWQAGDLAAELSRAAGVVANGLDFGDWSGLSDVVEPIIRRVAEDGAVAALLRVMPEPAAGMVTNIRSRAVKWAHERAAEMVGMKRAGGGLVRNPAAEWQITEGTREMIRAQVAEAMRNGDSVQELAVRLKESHAFGNARARTIARTETAMADGMGNLIGWEGTGLVAGKQWITAKDDKVSDVCNANGGMGVIGLHEPFSHGALTIPGHPNCRCAVVPVLAGDMPES